MRTKEADAERQRQRRAADREAYNARALERYYANRDERLQRDKEWRAANRESYNASRRRWRAANKDVILRQKRESRLRNLAYYLANNAMRRAALLQRCPSWVDRGTIKMIYAGCPNGHHVDHIVPLRGTTPEGWQVSGLHVPWNLQYLTDAANRMKGARMTRSDWLLCTEIAAMPLTAQEITVAL